jgi:hypothetical protein
MFGVALAHPGANRDDQEHGPAGRSRRHGHAAAGVVRPDEVQQQILQHFIESSKKLAQAEKAKARSGTA